MGDNGGNGKGTAFANASVPMPMKLANRESSNNSAQSDQRQPTANSAGAHSVAGTPSSIAAVGEFPLLESFSAVQRQQQLSAISTAGNSYNSFSATSNFFMCFLSTVSLSHKCLKNYG